MLIKNEFCKLYEEISENISFYYVLPLRLYCFSIDLESDDVWLVGTAMKNYLDHLVFMKMMKKFSNDVRKVARFYEDIRSKSSSQERIRKNALEDSWKNLYK